MVYTVTEKSTINSELTTHIRMNRSILTARNLSISMQSVVSMLKHVFLPVGYPKTVRPEYITYQMWDSVQGISSYLRAVLTTRSVLSGAGVGSTTVTPLTAALVWVSKDGVGMVGSLTFAYFFSEHFEVYTKEWRLFADVLNNIGLTLDLLSSLFPEYFMLITSVSVLCKSCCGLVAGATKARISAHFARTGHLADVTVKESTQETAVALCGLVVGMLLTKGIGTDDRSTWVVFLVLLVVHQYANYRLVKVLQFNTLNPQRCYLICTELMARRGSKAASAQMFPSPAQVAARESLVLPLRLGIEGPLFGVSVGVVMDGLRHSVENSDGGAAMSVAQDRFDKLCQVWQGQCFLVGLTRTNRVAVCLADSCVTAQQLIQAHCVGYYIHEELKAVARSSADHTSPAARLASLYGILMVRFAGQALRWYSEMEPRLFFKHEQSPQQCQQGDADDERDAQWNVDDTSSLKPGEWRYHLDVKTE